MYLKKDSVREGSCLAKSGLTASNSLRALQSQRNSAEEYNTWFLHGVSEPLRLEKEEVLV
jgi:hypothetical protein